MSYQDVSAKTIRYHENVISQLVLAPVSQGPRFTCQDHRRHGSLYLCPGVFPKVSVFPKLLSGGIFDHRWHCQAIRLLTTQLRGPGLYLRPRTR